MNIANIQQKFVKRMIIAKDGAKNDHNESVVYSVVDDVVVVFRVFVGL